jgi:hypothetical protein
MVELKFDIRLDKGCVLGCCEVGTPSENHWEIGSSYKPCINYPFGELTIQAYLES